MCIRDRAMSIQAMNTQVTKVQGMGNEDISQNEETVYYDVRFNAIAPSTEEHGNIRLIINAEAQNRFKPKYPLTKRAVYYGSRLISAPVSYTHLDVYKRQGEIQRVCRVA